MSNRFRTLPQPLDPTMYQYAPQEFIPDMSGLTAVTTGLQKAYDASEKIPVPKHLQVDANDVAERYVKPLQSMRQQAVDQFASGNMGDGMRALKQMQTHIYNMKQPGGLYDQYEKNYNAAQEYRKQIDKMYQDGDITSERRDALIGLSNSRFPGTFNEEGDFNPFTGISAARNIAIGEKALEAANGWASSQEANGYLQRDPSTGTYLYANTREFVDFDEVRTGVRSVLMQNQEVMSDLRQAADLRGLQGEQANEWMSKQLDVAAEAAAMKEGFVKDKKQFYKDWGLEQQRDFDFQKAQEMGQLSSNMIRMATGMKELDVDEAGNIKIGTETTRAGSWSMTSPLSDFVNVKDKRSKVGLDEAIKNNPELAKEYPGLTEVVNTIPRYTTDEQGNPIIMDAGEYNKKVKKAYDDLYARKKDTSFGVDTFEDPKQIRDAAEVMDAQFGLRAYTMISPNKAPQTISPDDLLTTLELEDPDDLKKRFVPVGVTRADSPWGMNSYLMAGKDSEGKTFHVIASPTGEKAANYAKPFQELLQPSWDMSMKETKPVPIYNPNTNETLFYKSERQMQYNPETGTVEDDLIFYVGEPNEDGTDIESWTPTDLTQEEITESATRSNPFHPAKRK